MIVKLLYGCGVRGIECVRLRIKDLDFDYGQIVVRDGKGQKNRVTMLPVFLKEHLLRHLEKVKAVHKYVEQKDYLRISVYICG